MSERYSADRLIEPYDEDATHVDWRDWGLINPVRAQGSCGSCYAFAAVTALETTYAIKYGALNEYSEQQLVDCQMTAFGCAGGFYSLSFFYWFEEGVNMRDQYVYESGDTGTSA